MIDLDDYHLQVAKRFGATAVVNTGDGQAAAQVMALIGGRGGDTAAEAVGVPSTFVPARTSSHPAGRSRMRECTAEKRICIWSGSGPLRPGRQHPRR